MVKDFVGNELKVGDIVLDLNEKKVCTIEKLYNKEVTTSLEVERAIKTWNYYFPDKECPEKNKTKYHKRATCVVKIIVPESK